MEYKVKIEWKNNKPNFEATFDRTHSIQFNGGSVLKNTSAPEFSGNPELPNPEELFVSSIATCFMLTFLALSANRKYQVKQYEDNPVGMLGKNEAGKMAMLSVTLHPKVEFFGDNQPDEAAIQQLLSKSHQYCFISNSVKCEISYQLEA